MKVLFVCMGNICRSPTAQGVFLSLLRQADLHDIVAVDSAGTHAWDGGRAPDMAAQASARKHGIDLSDLRSRPVVQEDYEHYDHIVAMDESNRTYMFDQCEARHRHKLGLLLEYAKTTPITEVPDPYGGGIERFDMVYDLIAQGCLGLLSHLQEVWE